MRILIDAFIGSRNLGDQAIFEGLVRRLRESGRDLHLTAVTCDADFAHPLVDELIPERQRHQLRRAIGASDLVVYGGGGLIQDETSVFNMARHASHWRLIRAAGVPLVFAGIGIGPLRFAWSRARAAEALDYATVTAVRDGASFEIAAALSALGARDGRLVLTGDLAAGLEVPGVISDPEARRTGICVSLRDLQGGFRLLPRAAAWKLGLWRSRRSQALVERVAAALVEVAGAVGEPVTFLSMWPGRDEVVARPLIGRLEAEGCLDGVVAARTPQDALTVIGRSRVAVGMRLHSVILAAKSRTPFVAISYSGKVRAFVQEAGLVENCLEAADLDRVELAGRIIETVADESAVRERIDRGMSAYETRERQNIDLILSQGEAR